MSISGWSVAACCSIRGKQFHTELCKASARPHTAFCDRRGCRVSLTRLGVHTTIHGVFRNRELPPKSYLRSDVTLEQLLEWLYEADHVKLSYGLKYNGVELEKLSPGTKGIVLLILYLGIDIDDSRPLVVDQPDENLDNELIYSLLTAYFKSAKKRRQIILITHNPNLVVNGDSEQVIVAHAERRSDGLPHLMYKSGALENPNIREQVCRILEGGTDAFLKREQRYSLGPDARPD